MVLRFAAFKGRSFVSRLIRFWTRSPYSHIAFVLDMENGTLIEPWTHGSPWKIWWDYSSLDNHSPGTEVEFYAKEVEENKGLVVVNFLKTLAENKMKYDLKGVLGFVVKCSDEKSTYFCSEGCAVALVKADIWPKRLATHLISPVAFVQLCLVSNFRYEGTLIL